MLRPADREWRDRRGRGARQEREAEPHEVPGRTGGSFRRHPQGARGRARDHRRVSLASQWSVGALGNGPRAAHRSLDGSHHRLARARNEDRPRVPARGGELQPGRTRPSPVMRRILAVLCLALAAARPGTAQDTPAAQPLTLQVFRLEGATVYKADDVLWLLRLREGGPLADDAAAIAKRLEDHYRRDGYAQARVNSTFESGRLTLTVDEGRIDEIELLGVGSDDVARMRR